MEKARNFNDIDNNEDNLKNLKNVFLFILIIIIAYLIEISKPNGIFRKIYIIIIIFIVIGFIGKNLSGKNFYNFKWINWIKRKIPFLSSLNKSSKDINNKINKKQLERIRNIYAHGYSSNKKNNINRNINEPNSPYDISDFSKYNYPKTNYSTYQNNNDEYLANKISNINKINAGTPNIMDSFYTNNNYNDNNYQSINNNINKNMNTKFGFKQDSSYNKFNTKKGKNNFLNVENPFNAQSRNKNYSDSSSSGNYFLFNTNKNKDKISFNDVINTNPINKFIGHDNYQNISNIISNNQMKKIPKNKEVSI